MGEVLAGPSADDHFHDHLQPQPGHAPAPAAEVSRVAAFRDVNQLRQIVGFFRISGNGIGVGSADLREFALIVVQHSKLSEARCPDRTVRLLEYRSSHPVASLLGDSPAIKVEL